MITRSGILADRICLVTGAGRGIGYRIACAMGQEGAVIAICELDSKLGAQALEEFTAMGILAEFFSVDLSARGEPRRLVEAVLHKFGRIDVIVNNARAGKRLSFAEETEDNWDIAFDVNLKAIFFLAQAALPVMSQDGAIVNISSITAKLVTHEAASYQVTKAGLLQLTRYLATVGGKNGIRVNTILPGFIVQDEHRSRYEREDNAKYRAIVEHLHPLRGGPGHSDDIARTAIFLASKNSGFITGQEIIVDGGLTIQDQATLLVSYVMG